MQNNKDEEEKINSRKNVLQIEMKPQNVLNLSFEQIKLIAKQEQFKILEIIIIIIIIRHCCSKIQTKAALRISTLINGYSFNSLNVRLRLIEDLRVQLGLLANQIKIHN